MPLDIIRQYFHLSENMAKNVPKCPQPLLFNDLLFNDLLFNYSLFNCLLFNDLEGGGYRFPAYCQAGPHLRKAVRHQELRDVLHVVLDLLRQLAGGHYDQP